MSFYSSYIQPLIIFITIDMYDVSYYKKYSIFGFNDF